jgi:Asp-tRNA(Asn)/Glu-tRNA(Gln) amidotransferase A subunit family amidase
MRKKRKRKREKVRRPFQIDRIGPRFAIGRNIAGGGMRQLNQLSASEAAPRLAAREITAEQMARACLARIEERESAVHAWIHLDPDVVLAQARQLDRGPVRGPLHGLPLGVKDLIDTADMPTAYGSPVYAGHRPRADAACVALARSAGALVLGKTVTTEFAWFHPGKTANPRNPSHTPGGSSSGSAAAVADCMVPLAFGTQTAGSIIRPASYCGIVGYKPTHGTLPRAGIKPLSDSLDTLGTLTRSVADAALLVSALSGRELLPGPLHQAPRIGLCRTHEWHAAQPETTATMENIGAALGRAGAKLSEIVLPQVFAGVAQAQIDIMNYEIHAALACERLQHYAGLSDKLKQLLENARQCDAARYDEALRLVASCRSQLEDVFAGVDVLLAPSAPGEAPAGLGATGDPVFCRAWTALHVPAINLPCGLGPHGLPVGLQVIGRGGDDARALAVADWVHQRVS